MSRSSRIGKDAWFAAMYSEHLDLVRRCARKLGVASSEVDDVAQDVFFVAARRLDSFDERSARLTTWLYGITLNVVRGWRRRARSRIREDSDAEAGEPVDEKLDRALVLDAWRIANRVFMKMSPAKRDTYVLAEFCGLSCSEIAALVGVKEETVWSRLHYARREFRALLDHDNRATA